MGQGKVESAEGDNDGRKWWELLESSAAYSKQAIHLIDSFGGRGAEVRLWMLF